MLRKDRGLSAVVIAALALGIGANTAVFSLVGGVILRPLGYRDAARLYAVHEVVPRFSQMAPLIPVNAMHYREWRRSVHSFEETALLGGITLNLTGSGEPERIAAARVSPSLFHMLGVVPQLGRAFVEQEDHPGRDDVVVLRMQAASSRRRERQDRLEAVTAGILLKTRIPGVWRDVGDPTRGKSLVP